MLLTFVFLWLPVCHQSCTGAWQKDSTFRESFHVQHLPEVGQVWDGLGVFIIMVFVCITHPYGLFLWQKHSVRSCIAGRGWSTECRFSRCFTSSWRQWEIIVFTFHGWCWVNPMVLAGEVGRHTCICNARMGEYMFLRNCDVNALLLLTDYRASCSCRL